jgi:hypothetical protein
VIKIKSKIFQVLLVVLVLMAGVSSFVSAEDTYLDSLNAIKTQISSSEKNVRDDINSFNTAFKDTFRLVDDEISRLILANGAMVGVVFAIMFLVYAKTTSRTKRDLQILLAAHAKHIDNLISTRLDEFESKIDARFRARNTTALSKLGGDFDDVITNIVGSDGEMGRRRSRLNEVVEVPQENHVVGEVEQKSIVSPAVIKQVKQLARVEEAHIGTDGKVKILKESTGPLNRMKKRLRRGLMRLLGMNKAKEKVQEFKK